MSKIKINILEIFGLGIFFIIIALAIFITAQLQPVIGTLLSGNNIQAHGYQIIFPSSVIGGVLLSAIFIFFIFTFLFILDKGIVLIEKFKKSSNSKQNKLPTSK